MNKFSVSFLGLLPQSKPPGGTSHVRKRRDPGDGREQDVVPPPLTVGGNPLTVGGNPGGNPENRGGG